MVDNVMAGGAFLALALFIFGIVNASLVIQQDKDAFWVAIAWAVGCFFGAIALFVSYVFVVCIIAIEIRSWRERRAQQRS